MPRTHVTRGHTASSYLKGGRHRLTHRIAVPSNSESRLLAVCATVCPSPTGNPNKEECRVSARLGPDGGIIQSLDGAYRFVSLLSRGRPSSLLHAELAGVQASVWASVRAGLHMGQRQRYGPRQMAGRKAGREAQRKRPTRPQSPLSAGPAWTARDTPPAPNQTHSGDHLDSTPVPVLALH